MTSSLLRFSPAVFFCILFSSRSSALPMDTVRYHNGATEISASLLMPEGERSVPGVVIIHGSGPSSRTNPWTTAYAKALTERGIAVLYPDKRGSGSSKGSWQTASFHDLAGDASAGIRYLRGVPRIDTSRIGVIAFSQGGYPASILAAEDPLNKFTVVISGGTAGLMEQTINELELEAARAGVVTDDVNAAVLRSVFRRAFRFATTGTGWNELMDTLQTIRNSRSLASQGLRTFPGDSAHWIWRWIRAAGDFDPIPYWRSNRSPVLFLYGGNDTQIFTAASIQRLLKLPPPALKPMAIHFYGGNGHALYRDDGVDFIRRWIVDQGKN